MKHFLSFFGQALISGGFIALAALSARAGMVTNLACVADTTLQEDFPDNNTGGANSFTAGGRNLGGPTRALLQFDVAGAIPAGATINSGTLTLTVANTNGPDSTFALHRVLASWGEGTGSNFQGGSPGGENDATWKVRLGPANPWDTAGGDFVPAASATQSISGTGGYSFGPATLAADLQAWLDNPGTNFGWLLRSESETTPGTIRRFIGRLDTSSSPQLTIDYSPAASAAQPPVITNVAPVGNQIRFSFVAESNRTYTVEIRDSLTAGTWTPLTNLPAQSASSIFHLTNLLLAAESYFRVSTP